MRKDILIVVNQNTALRNAEKLAWDELTQLDPSEVCRRSGAFFVPAKEAFRLKVFSEEVDVNLKYRNVTGNREGGESLWKRIREYGDVAVVRYLIHALDIPFAGELINPTELPGGQIYRIGSHVLPLDLVARKYRHDKKGFVELGMRWGGSELALADASFLVYPLPRVAIALLLWCQCDEFPARSVLLVDSSVGRQLPPDIIWLITMMVVTVTL